MKRWKFCFYPVWNFSKCERFLSNMERQGLYPVERRFCFFYKFRKAPQKDTGYFLVHTPVGRTVSSYSLENSLKKDFAANVIIDATFESPRVYRIRDVKKDMTCLKSERDRILKRECAVKFICALLVMTFLGLLPIIFREAIVINIGLLSHLICVVPLAIYTVYNLIGWIVLKLHISKYQNNI